MSPERGPKSPLLALLIASVFAPIAWSGCDYSPAQPDLAAPPGMLDPGALPVPEPTASGPAAPALSPEERTAERSAILENVVKLIQSAAITPGGDSFGNATKNLNQLFAGTPDESYSLETKARAFLLQSKLPPKRVNELEASSWTMPDARHLEDCMLYHGIAARVGGAGDDLTRVRRVFDWCIRQVQLVPAGSLAAPQLGQAYARPYDVLLRGMATEAEGIWAERGWLFLCLCRQLGLDGGLVTYTPPGGKDPIVWCTAILIDGKPYLFDTRIGLPIPDPSGSSVATLEDALTDPDVLARLDLPGQSPYGTSRDALLKSPTRIGILIDSSLRYFAPRMKLLQQSLAGKYLTILYRNPAEQRDAWTQALGDRLDQVGLWELPDTVETLLFTNGQFVESTQKSLFLFRPEFPLLYARMKQLRGETSDAISDYVAMRFATNAVLKDPRKTPMPKEIQDAIDVHATYFLAMCHLDQDNARQAETFFEATLKLLPEPGRGQPTYNMFRWGAQYNLGRLNEAKGNTPRAIAFDSLLDPTSQYHGNLLRARDLLWPTPLSPPAPTLPPAPTPAPPPAAPGTV